MNKFKLRPNKSLAEIVDINRNRCSKLDVTITQEEFNNLMPIRVQDLGLSVRASNSLISNQITNLMDLVKCSRENLLSCDYIGESTANEIEDYLNACGLSLADNRVYKSNYDYPPVFVESTPYVLNPCTDSFRPGNCFKVKCT